MCVRVCVFYSLVGCFVLFYGLSTLFGSFSAEYSIYIHSNVKTVQFSVKTVLLPTIQFTISTQFMGQKSSISSNSV